MGHFSQQGLVGAKQEYFLNSMFLHLMSMAKGTFLIRMINIP